jgi:hypothetical protein
MILGCILLLLILNGYEFKTTVSALTRPSSTSLALAFDRDGQRLSTARV